MAEVGVVKFTHPECAAVVLDKLYTLQQSRKPREIVFAVNPPPRAMQQSLYMPSQVYPHCANWLGQDISEKLVKDIKLPKLGVKL